MAFRHFLAVLVATLALAPPSARAEVLERSGALPAAVRSAGVTEAQWQTLQTRFSSLAQETNLRASAIQNVAVEIFGAQQGLDFDSYVALIANGAHQLRAFLTDAQARADPDPASAALRQSAIAAASDGRLSEARALYDQLIATNRAARQRVRDAEDLADAEDMAESARVAYASGDLLDAASRFGQAADLLRPSPATDEARWNYRLMQGNVLNTRAELFGETAPLTQAIQLYRETLRTISTRDAHPSGWATTQLYLADSLSTLARQTLDTAVIRDAEAAYRASLQVLTSADSPELWATAQLGLAESFLSLALLGDDEGVADLRAALEAVAASQEVLSQASEPRDWAVSQTLSAQINAELRRRGIASDDERDLLAAALPVLRSAVAEEDQTSLQRAHSQMVLAQALSTLGSRPTNAERGDRAALREAVALYENAEAVFTPQSAPAYFIRIQVALAGSYLELAGHGETNALDNAAAAARSALALQTQGTTAWADSEATLGAILRLQAENGDVGALRQSVAAFRAALTRGETGQVQETRRLALGFALFDLACRGDIPSLSEAVEQFTQVASDAGVASQSQIDGARYGLARAQALTARRAEAPAIARAQRANATAIETSDSPPRSALIDLGIALQLQEGVLVEDTRLGRASALRAVIVRYANAPNIAAAAQYYLGDELVYADSDILEQGISDVFAFLNARATAYRLRDDAAAAFQAALTRYTLENNPVQYTRAHYQLGHFYMRAADGDPEKLQQAITEMTLALRGYQTQGDVRGASGIQHELDDLEQDLQRAREQH
ncbi:MAG: hypothetical protein KF779_09815 [Hyphomonadaceae bacterium]|nr:hypothetical protein [Hyphomonadaceae bacterium]